MQIKQFASLPLARKGRRSDHAQSKPLPKSKPQGGDEIIESNKVGAPQSDKGDRRFVAGDCNWNAGSGPEIAHKTHKWPERPLPAT
jgi:hypothetical protein